MSDTPMYNGALEEQADFDAILTAVAAEARRDEPASPEALALVERWRAHIARYHNGCDRAKLERLGQLYGADDRFLESMDSFGPGTAHFLSEAIAAYLEQS